MIPKAAVALAIADTMLARDAALAGLIASAAWTLGGHWPWIPSLCEAVRARTGDDLYFYSRQELAELILEHDGFAGAWQSDEAPPHITNYCLSLPISPPQPAWLAALGLPELATIKDLAQWLLITPAQLDWYADQWRVESPCQSALQHYHYRWVEKRSGGCRLIEIPKKHLRVIQQTILRAMLDRVPPHPAAHGFRPGHSCVTHAALHTGKRAVIRMDLQNFFPSIPASRIHALFAKLGYSDSVAGALARICVNRTPAGAVRDKARDRSIAWAAAQQLRSPHLPQGSPCSPALANLCAYRLDLRLAALAQSLGATYSRYADDLVFSGDRELERALDRFHVRVAAIAIEEGFVINTRKTRLMRAGTRQQVTGIVINEHPNVSRVEFDALKATLVNCVRHGPESQNRDGREYFQSYLTGKVAYVRMVNRGRGDKLQEILNKICWPQ